jgi:hypothetical protein
MTTDSHSDQTTRMLDDFERSTDRAFHIGLARNCLAAVPDAYTEDQLDDIGRRARHWTLKALRAHLEEATCNEKSSV